MDRLTVCFVGFLLLCHTCQASTEPCDASENSQCNILVPQPTEGNDPLLDMVWTSTATQNSTVIYLQAQLDAVRAQLAGLEAQVKQLRLQAATHTEQLAAIQTISASGQQAAKHHVTSATEAAQPATFTVRPTGTQGSAWLDHFLLLSLLRFPAPVDPSSAAPITAPDGDQQQPADSTNTITGAHPDTPASSTGALGSLGRSVDVTSVAVVQVDVSHPAMEKVPRYVALGGADGNVAIYSTRGALTLMITTGSSSPVTAISSHPVRKNESVLVTGHANGEVRLFALLQQVPGQENAPPRSHAARAGKATIKEAELRFVVRPGQNKDGLNDEAGHSISQILPIRGVTRTPTRRHYAVWDARGWLRVLRENGTVRSASHSNTSLLASSQNAGQLVSLSSTHVLVHKQQLSGGYKVNPCQALNGTRMIAAAFDPARPHRAYAINNIGQLVLLSVPHEGKMGMCKVVRSYTLPLQALPTAVPCSSTSASLATTGSGSEPSSDTHQQQHQQEGSSEGGAGQAGTASSTSTGALSQCYPEGSMALFSLRGYVLLVHAKGSTLYNVSSVRLTPSTPLVAEPWTPLTGMLGLSWSEADSGLPMITGSTSGSGMVLLGLGSTVVVMESELPIPDTLAQAQLGQNKSLWAQPLFFGAMLLVGVWQFMKARNRASANSPANFSSRMSGMGLGPDLFGSGSGRGVDGMRFGGQGGGAGRGFAGLGGGLPGMGGAGGYRAAMEAIRAGGRGAGGSRGKVFGMDDDDEDEEEMDGGRTAGGVFSGRAPKRGVPPGAGSNLGYGGSGFAGPRSVRRGMRMGVPPIAEQGHEGNDQDDDEPPAVGEHIDS